MIEESNEYYDNLIKQVEKSISELTKGADEAGKAASNAAGNVGNAINKLKDTINTGKTLSYYIWTAQDETVLANAKAGLEDLDILLEKHPENSRYAQLKDDVATFVNELENLRDTRLITDDFTDSLNTLKNSEDEYLRLFKDAILGVEERVKNTANYSERILEIVTPIADKTGELKKTLDGIQISSDEKIRESGEIAEQASSSVDNAQENINRLTGSVADAVLKVSNDSELLNGAVGGISDAVMNAATSSSENFSNLATDVNNATSSISADAGTVNDALDSISDSERFDNLTNSFGSLGEAILGISQSLGISEEGTVGGLVSALNAINEISLGGETGGIIGQFYNLKAAIDDVSAAIAGGVGSEGTASKGSGSTSGSSATGGKGTNSGSGGSSDSVTGALEQLQQTADKTVGNGESGSGDDDETVIGKFGILKNAVNAVAEAIGLEEGAEGDENLIGALMAEFNTANDVLPQEEQLFNELESSIQACVSALRAMIDALNEINSIGVPSVGGGSSHANGTVGNAFAKGTEGKAFAKGHNGLSHDEKNALRSENGQMELTLYPDGTTELTTKPIMSDLPKGTVIFNEEQTKRIIEGKPTATGKAHASGTVADGVYITEDGQVFRRLSEEHPDMQRLRKFEAYMANIGNNLEKLVPNSVYEREHQMNEMVNQITNSNITNNKNVQPSINVGDIHVTCPGVTEQEVVRHLGPALNREFSGFSTFTDQWSRT